MDVHVSILSSPHTGTSDLNLLPKDINDWYIPAQDVLDKTRQRLGQNILFRGYSIIYKSLSHFQVTVCSLNVIGAWVSCARGVQSRFPPGACVQYSNSWVIPEQKEQPPSLARKPLEYKLRTNPSPQVFKTLHEVPHILLQDLSLRASNVRLAISAVSRFTFVVSKFAL